MPCRRDCGIVSRCRPVLPMMQVRLSHRLAVAVASAVVAGSRTRALASTTDEASVLPSNRVPATGFTRKFRLTSMRPLNSPNPKLKKPAIVLSAVYMADQPNAARCLAIQRPGSGLRPWSRPNPFRPPIDTTPCLAHGARKRGVEKLSPCPAGTTGRTKTVQNLGNWLPTTLLE